MQKQRHARHPSNAEWIPLSRSLSFILRSKRLFGWSFLLFLITVGLTWLGYHLTVGFMDRLTGNFLAAAPATESILGWIKYGGWWVGSRLFLIVSRIVAFYFAFLLAYSLSTPGYAFLSTAAEKLYSGDRFNGDAGSFLAGFFADILEGIKIALFGVLVTIVALVVNFLPAVGQAIVFLLYTYYSALMFIDYPASRRHWSLGEKLHWLRAHSSPAFRLGVLPAVVSMIPLVNIFAIALLFPLLTVHTTLNFSAIEQAKNLPETSSPGEFHGQRN
jgi:CysZ protein